MMTLRNILKKGKNSQPTVLIVRHTYVMMLLFATFHAILKHS